MIHIVLKKNFVRDIRHSYIYGVIYIIQFNIKLHMAFILVDKKLV